MKDITNQAVWLARELPQLNKWTFLCILQERIHWWGIEVNGNGAALEYSTQVADQRGLKPETEVVDN